MTDKEQVGQLAEFIRQQGSLIEEQRARIEALENRLGGAPRGSVETPAKQRPRRISRSRLLQGVAGAIGVVAAAGMTNGNGVS